MTSSEDTEITLGTGKLLVLFFGLVAICALFFALGYSLGRKAEPGIVAGVTSSPQTASSSAKPAGNSAAPPMTFYKAVEQKDANAELTPSTNSKAETPANSNGASSSANAAAAQTDPNAAPDPASAIAATTYNVQVAAVSKQDDADALVDALKKKQYPAFVAAVTGDKLFRVQVGPFSDVKDAEATRTRLISDGYNPILKK